MANSIVEYERPDQAELLQDANAAMEIAQSFKVTTQSTYEIAAEEVKDIKTKIKTLNEKRMSITRPLDEVKESIMSLFRPAITKLEEAQRYYERGMLEYISEQEKIRREEQARAEAAARAERERLAAEARAKEEEARKLEEEARAKAAKMKDKEKAAQLLAEAEAAAAQKRDESIAAETTASVVTAVPVATAKPTAAGTGIRKTWKARCDNKLELLQFIVANPAYIELVEINQSALNKIASAQKNNMQVGGCVAYEESGIVSRK